MTSDISQTNEWLQRLQELQTKNVYLKNKLADKVHEQGSLATDVLERIELLQTQLLNRDAAISLLRHEISVRAKRPANGILSYSTDEQLKLESNLQEMEKGWLLMMQTFNDCLPVN